MPVKSPKESSQLQQTLEEEEEAHLQHKQTSEVLKVAVAVAVVEGEALCWTLRKRAVGVVVVVVVVVVLMEKKEKKKNVLLLLPLLRSAFGQQKACAASHVPGPQREGRRWPAFQGGCR